MALDPFAHFLHQQAALKLALTALIEYAARETRDPIGFKRRLRSTLLQAIAENMPRDARDLTTELAMEVQHKTIEDLFTAFPIPPEKPG